MRSRFRKIGLLFSAAAVLFTAFVLPLHHHEEGAPNNRPAHCSVCHFSKEGKTSSVTGSVSGVPIPLREMSVILGLRLPDLPLFAGYVSQRAPPAV